MEGRYPNRFSEALTSGQKRVFVMVSVVLAALATGVGIWAAITPGTYGRSGNGCVNVVVPSTTGGGILHKCGADAQALCKDALTRHDRLGRLTQAECVKAGFTQQRQPSGR